MNPLELLKLWVSCGQVELKWWFSTTTGHPGGSLSCADIVAYLWKEELTYHGDKWKTQDTEVHA